MSKVWKEVLFDQEGGEGFEEQFSAEGGGGRTRIRWSAPYDN